MWFKIKFIFISKYFFSFIQISNQDKLIPSIPLLPLRNHSHPIFYFSLPFLYSEKHLTTNLLTCFQLGMLCGLGSIITVILSDLPFGPLDHFLLSNRLVLLGSQEG